MKTLSLFLSSLALLIGFFGTGCEMHSPSETIPGYAEKEPAEKQKKEQEALTPEGAQTNSPSYFPKETPKD